MALRLTSPAFRDGGAMPPRYTSDGLDLSPPLEWSGAPSATRSFCLVVEDPDAPGGTWVHWLVYGMPATQTRLEEAVPRAHHLAGGVRQGRNGYGRIGWGGPSPPPGAPHRYYFELRALDDVPRLGPGASREELERATHGHVLERAQIVALYGRSSR